MRRERSRGLRARRLLGRFALERALVRAVFALLSRSLAPWPDARVERLAALLAAPLPWLDRRGARRARENARAVFGEAADVGRLRAASYQNWVRSALLAGLPPRWEPEEAEDVVVTARVGAWPLLGRRPLVDRDDSRGPRVPFLGLEARSPAAPARRALARRRALRLALALPDGRGRWTRWVSPDLAADLGDASGEDAVRLVTARVQDVLGHVVRARPDLWLWTLPRFSARPEVPLGRWPRYSRLDPRVTGRRSGGGPSRSRPPPSPPPRRRPRA